jgi:ergothioneine biosynthesis protein EgtB
VPIAAQQTRSSPEDRRALAARYVEVRARTRELCRPLAAEDYVVQSMADTSPAKWHLAHVTWFFENFLLAPFLRDYEPYHPRYGYLFNSYYETVGKFFPRAQRGLLSRPTVEEILGYREHVDERMHELLDCTSDGDWREVAARITLGLHHEQQHQELILTDVKHLYACNPLRPAYREGTPAPRGEAASAPGWSSWPAGVYEIGHDGNGFAFDNEGPRHRVYLNAFRLGGAPVTNAEYLEFMDAGGYANPVLWLSQGWQAVREKGWQAPLYWERSGEHSGGAWHAMTLAGLRRVDGREPVCHVSYFEADAYARWRGRRLPTEAEWEVVGRGLPVSGNFYESGHLHPAAARDGLQPAQMYGDVWEWTQSAYSPYPGYRPPAGALGEYNGKFMSGQYVLRGGSCVSPAGHVRATYRNFFYPADRWQFTGIRLAE